MAGRPVEVRFDAPMSDLLHIEIIEPVIDFLAPQGRYQRTVAEASPHEGSRRQPPMHHRAQQWGGPVVVLVLLGIVELHVVALVELLDDFLSPCTFGLGFGLLRPGDDRCPEKAEPCRRNE
jgi:hypothetical protein